MPIQAGTRLGAYEVTSLIGHGAMGTVYLARHEALDRIAALKVLQAIGDDPAAVGRFRREGRAIALLRHPNIVTVYDYGEFEGTPYMIEEYVPGGSLADRLKEGKPDKVKALMWLRAIAAGLDYAHQKGIVHRDIKPANVLMTQEGTPVIADFGLAKVEQQATMTASGVATGTPAYMAPEQITDTGVIGPASDLYALATVAYEMLTGRLPFEADNVMRLLMAKIRDDPVAPLKRDPSLPKRVDSVLLRGLSREPASRWSSCSAMVEALAGVLEPVPELFATTRRFENQRRFNRPKWALIALPVVGVLAVLVGVMLFVVPALFPPAPGLVACPAVTPSPPQIFASPNPVAAGQPLSFSGSGFTVGDPFFIVVDNVGDCTNPTNGFKVYSIPEYAEPLQTEPSPLPDIPVGSYQLRGCTHRTGEPPTNCVQVPFSIGPALASAARTASPTP